MHLVVLYIHYHNHCHMMMMAARRWLVVRLVYHMNQSYTVMAHPRMNNHCCLVVAMLAHHMNYLEEDTH